MLVRSAVVFLALLVPSAEPTREELAKRETAAMQGEWVMVSGERNSVAFPDKFLKTGSTGKDEKQTINCILITKDNAAKLKDFVLGR